MGKQKYIKDIENFFEKSPVVNYKSIEMIIKEKKNIKQYTKQFIRNQVLKGKIKKLVKGYYTIYDNINLSVHCFKPSYLGLQDALSYHNLWEQETTPIIITIRKVKPGIREILGLNVMIKRINRKYLFGFDYIKDGDFYFPVSDIEKTFIDMIYYKQYMDEELIHEFRQRIDKKRLKEYLKEYPQLIRKRVEKLMKEKE